MTTPSTYLTAAGRSRVDRAAGEILATLPRDGDGSITLPVDIERIARAQFGLRVIRIEGLAGARTKNTSGMPLSGLLAFSRNRIYIESRDDPRRQRFTIAHELAHVKLRHHELFASDAHVLGQGELPAWMASAPPTGEVATAEQEANRLAGLLLVPPAELDRLIERIGLSVPLLADAFKVSPPAMRLHLRTYLRPTLRTEPLA